jgi:hypothetical protein
LRDFCSKRQFDNRVLGSKEKLVLWLQDIVHMPTKSARKGRDVTPVRLQKRRKGGVLLAYEQIIDHLAKELEMPLGAFSYVG